MNNVATVVFWAMRRSSASMSASRLSAIWSSISTVKPLPLLALAAFEVAKLTLQLVLLVKRGGQARLPATAQNSSSLETGAGRCN